MYTIYKMQTINNMRKIRQILSDADVFLMTILENSILFFQIDF